MGMMIARAYAISPPNLLNDLATIYHTVKSFSTLVSAFLLPSFLIIANCICAIFRKKKELLTVLFELTVTLL